LGLAVIAVVLGGAAAYRFRPVAASSVPDAAPPSQSEPVQEVAQPRSPLEGGRGAEPQGAVTPAPVTIATLRKDETRVKTPKQKSGLGSVGKVAGVVAAACVGATCPGGQLRLTPPPEEGPRRAVETMEKLGIDVGEAVHPVSTNHGSTISLSQRPGLPEAAR
jgi:hypothetical protein